MIRRVFTTVLFVAIIVDVRSNCEAELHITQCGSLEGASFKGLIVVFLQLGQQNNTFILCSSALIQDNKTVQSYILCISVTTVKISLSQITPTSGRSQPCIGIEIGMEMLPCECKELAWLHVTFHHRGRPCEVHCIQHVILEWFIFSILLNFISMCREPTTCIKFSSTYLHIQSATAAVSTNQS